MALIPNWRQAGRMLSVQIAAAAVLFGALAPDQQAAILALLGVPPERITGFLGLAVILARVIDQPRIRGNDPSAADPAPLKGPTP